MKYFIYIFIFDCGYQAQEVWASSIKAGGLSEAIDLAIKDNYEDGSCPDCPSIILQIDPETGQKIKSYYTVLEEHQHIEKSWDHQVSSLGGTP